MQCVPPDSGDILGVIDELFQLPFGRFPANNKSESLDGGIRNRLHAMSHNAYMAGGQFSAHGSIPAYQRACGKIVYAVPHHAWGIYGNDRCRMFNLSHDQLSGDDCAETF